MLKGLLIVLLAAFRASTAASPSNVTLMQDENGVVCKSKGDSSVKEIRIDAKDTQIKAVERSGGRQNETVYDAVSFLDKGLLAKDSSGHALFHILENGRYVLVTGKLYDMKESDCADTGASKTCTNTGVNKLFWSAEKLELSADNAFINTKVTRYGHFPHDGTYFYGTGSVVAGRGRTALVLLDYGAKFQVLSGVMAELDCRYQK